MLHARDGVIEIRCETHDDFTVYLADGGMEIVSVRYRDAGRGRWTLASLKSDRVLEKLFGNWLRLGERPRCRLVTNCALGPDARKFKNCCEQGASRERLDHAISLRASLTAETEQIDRFLDVLVIESREVGRDNVEAVEARHLAPELRLLHLADIYDPRYFSAIVDAVARANRAVGVIDGAATDVSESARRRRQSDARSFDRAKVIGVLLDVGRGGEPLMASGTDSRRVATKLVRKLEAGGVPPTTVEAAQMLRAAWTDLESRWRAEVPGGDAEWNDLRARVLHIVSKAERSIDRSGQYGVEMLAEIERILTLDALGRLPAMQVSRLSLLGLVYEMSDECLIYFSPREAVAT